MHARGPSRTVPRPPQAVGRAVRPVLKPPGFPKLPAAAKKRAEGEGAADPTLASLGGQRVGAAQQQRYRSVSSSNSQPAPRDENAGQAAKHDTPGSLRFRAQVGTLMGHNAA